MWRWTYGLADHRDIRPEAGSSARIHLDDEVRGVTRRRVGSAVLVGIAFGAMMMLTSPDGWVMKAANQAMSTAQQGTLASYDVADDQ